MNNRWSLVMLFLINACQLQAADDRPNVVIGSKAFTESVILGEIATQLAQKAGAQATHLQQLGGSTVLWRALKEGGRNHGIDAYVEYTGTISQDLLKTPGIGGEDALRAELAKQNIAMSRPLGFNDTYALGMKEERAAQLNIRKISDLRDHPELKFGLSNEFIKRGDGWRKLRDAYDLPQKQVSGLEHSLAYRGLDNGAIDATDLYSTDPEIRYYGLRVIQDDLKVFPNYYAVLLYRSDLEKEAPDVVKALKELEGRISLAAMLEMNSRAKTKTGERVPESRIAADFLAENPYFHQDGEIESSAPIEESAIEDILKHTWQHLFLVAVSLTAAIVVALPLGIAATRWPILSQPILSSVGIIQTIPSLALLAFLVPLLHLGVKPALMALFLYSLLPIVRNTFTGLRDIPLQLRESAEALGLPAFARLRLIELPMASRSILAGIKTSAVINVGTATLGGLIGAGGYGEIIFTGLRLDNNWIILQGAGAAAVMALLVQGLFELAERYLVPRGLNLEAEH
jgi:osmoprotectant transport system permease protein